jgi:peptide/nickel transport system ATP-binding protein
MDINRHEILGVVGESGSGKSMFADSLLNAVVKPGILTGEITYKPESGDTIEVTGLEGRELKQLRWEEISMVFQGAMGSFNPTKKIKIHFTETLKSHDKDLDEGMNHARDTLENLYLDPDRVLDSYPHELSGGMKQRALIALSLVLKPEVLVMDEPTAALDLLMQRQILSLLEDIREEYDLTVVFITHDLPLIAGLADRLAVMYAFEFAEIGLADEIITNPTHPYTRALLKSVPNLDSPLSEMAPIEGSSPDPVNVPSGCSYAPRCPLAADICRETNPPFHDVSPSHQSACFFWEDSEQSIPLQEPIDSTETAIESNAAQSEEPILEVSDLEVHFGTNPGLLDRIRGKTTEVSAVDGVNIDIHENDVVSLVGESGCGKTTLGKAMVGLERPTGGKIEFQSDDIWELKSQRDDRYDDVRRSLQIIHQDPGSSLNPNRTVQGILSVPLKRWQSDLSPDDRQARIYSLLEYVGMTPPEDYAKRYPHQLSGGEKQRVALVRALLMNPSLILADEAVSALDVSLRVEMMDLMIDLQEKIGTSYIFISHDLSNARYISGKAGGRIGVMYLGKIVEIGPVDKIIGDPKHPYTKALRWASVDLNKEDTTNEAPLRGIDIPDPKNPPSGCRFHTRCPEAREVCKNQEPEHAEANEGQQVACFREYSEEHPYWESDPLV